MGEPRAFGGLARGPWAGGRVIAGPFAGCYSRIQHDLALAAMAERQRWAWMAGPRASSSASSGRSRSAPSGSVSGVTPGRGRAKSQVWQIFDGMRRHAQRVSADILKEEERLEAAFRATTTGRLEPVEPGHHDVDDDDVRPFLADKRDRHFAIGRFTDQRHVGVSLQDERHQPTDLPVVIDDENPW